MEQQRQDSLMEDEPGTSESLGDSLRKASMFSLKESSTEEKCGHGMLGTCDIKVETIT